MPSPFPGMDPYLEGYLWPDVHSALANKIRQQLTQIAPAPQPACHEKAALETPLFQGGEERPPDPPGLLKKAPCFACRASFIAGEPKSRQIGEMEID